MKKIKLVSLAVTQYLCKLRIVVIALGTAALLQPFAFAQNDSGEVIEEILVTAQKRTQNLQDVPMSVTAISGHSLERLGAEDILDYFATVPGLSFQSSGPAGDQHGDRFINIRGVSADTGSPTVGFYINETPIKFVDPNLFDVARVEVLRGPQGTLYGASSMGGTIKVVINEPDSSAFAGKLDASLSSVEDGSETYSFKGMLNIPVNDQLALRVVGFNRDEAGYIDNILSPTDVDEDFNSQTIRGGRIAAKFQATDNFSITPSVLHQELKVDADPTYKRILDVTAPEFAVGSIAPLAGRFTGDSLVTHQPTNSQQKETFTIYDITLNYDFENFSFVSSTSYYEREKSGIVDMSVILPFFFGPTAPVDNSLDDFETEDGFTAEVRLSSTTDGPFEWIVGGFYQDVETKFIQSLLDPDFNDIAFGGLPVVPGGLFLAFESNDNLKQAAVFADITYNVMDSLRLTAGLRWSDFDLSTAAQGDGLFNGPPSNQVGGASKSEFSPRFLVSYDINNELMTYATVSKGVRPGFGLFPIGAVCDAELQALGLSTNRTQVEPDSLWNYEVGFKGQFLDNKLTVNGSGYLVDWSDIQQNLSLACGFSTTINGGTAQSVGFELEVSAIPTDNLLITGGISYIDAELTEDSPNIGAVDGDRILRVADWNLSIAATYDYVINSYLDGYIRLDYQYVGDAISANYNFSTPVESFISTRPSYDVMNVRAGILYKDWELALFLRNALNERPRIGAGQFITSDINIYTLTPRSVGINILKSF